MPVKDMVPPLGNFLLLFHKSLLNHNTILQLTDVKSVCSDSCYHYIYSQNTNPFV